MANDATPNSLENSMDSDLSQTTEKNELLLDFDAVERALLVVSRSTFVGDSAAAVHVTQEMLKALKTAIIERLKDVEEEQ